MKHSKKIMAAVLTIKEINYLVVGPLDELVGFVTFSHL